MRIQLFLLFLFLPLLVKSQFAPVKDISDCSVCMPTRLVLADLDEDGNLDVLTASEGDNKISWSKNLGNNNFSAPIVISSVVNQASFVSVADLNDDGHLDVLATSSEDNKISWYENDGGGNFSDEQNILTELNSPKFVFGRDMDGDGDLDILIGTTFGEIVWYENNGLTIFDQAHLITEGLRFIHTLDVSDIDEDGDVDIVFSASFSSKMGLLENDGNGNFSEKFIATVFNTGDLEIIDLDGDNDLDIVATFYNWNERVVWYENDGMGNFLPEQLIYDDLYADRLTTIEVGDIDDDGDLDLLVASDTDFNITVLTNDGNTNFLLKTVLNVWREIPSGLRMADMNNDGALDFFVVKKRISKIDLYENDGTGNFKELPFINNIYEVNEIATGDFDGDGDLDIISGTFSSGELFFLMQQNEGLSFDYSLLETKLRGISYLDAGDFNNDGLIDILIISEYDQSLVWLENYGGGNFSDLQLISDQARFAEQSIIIDLDQDGDMDILAAHGDLAWYKNDGKGNFSSVIIISDQLKGLDGIYAGDLDGDGDLDVLSASHGDEKIAWYENDGNELFSDQKIITDEANYAFFVIAEDMDQDGDLDVLYAGGNRGIIAWYENDGSGNFSNPSIVNDLSHLHSGFTDVVDINGDGDLDLLFGKAENDDLSWYKNDGEGKFSDPIAIHPRTKVSGVAHFTDIDGDGDLDLLTGAEQKGIFLFENVSNYPIIQGQTFWDTNENGKLDQGEQLISNIPIQINPEAVATYTDSAGTFKYYLPDGTYRVSASADVCWKMTTDSNSYSITVQENTFSNLNFGFQLVGGEPSYQARLDAAPTRCNELVSFIASIENNSCQVSPIWYALILDPDISINQFSRLPDSVVNNTLFWFNDDLLPGEVEEIQLFMQMPNEMFIGDTIQVKTLIYREEDLGELELLSIFDFQSEIRCSFDPNDKLVRPNRIGDYDKNYTLFEESLDYTIRFQNTGNDTAFNIVIRDTLDKNLDWTTFKPIHSSHSFETFLYKDGVVEFSFKNILLPDSTTNEPLSHGLVTYKIATKKDLPENTIITNTANIYFDFNPPIVTNTTENVLVSELPKTTSINSLSIKNKIKVFPNPFSDFLYFEMEDFDYTNLPTIQIFDLTGSLITSEIMTTPSYRFPIPNLVGGMYFYKITNQNGLEISSGKLVKN